MAAQTPDDGYTVDLKMLDETTNRIASFVKKLASTMDDIDVEVARKCAKVWEGSGADSYQERQVRWGRAMTRAAGEVEEMRLAAHRAHENYSAAKAANRGMLGR